MKDSPSTLRAAWFLLGFAALVALYDAVIVVTDLAIWGIVAALMAGSNQPLGLGAWDVVREILSLATVACTAAAAGYAFVAANRTLNGDPRDLKRAATVALVIGAWSVVASVLSLNCCGLVTWLAPAALGLGAFMTASQAAREAVDA